MNIQGNLPKTHFPNILTNEQSGNMVESVLQHHRLLGLHFLPVFFLLSHLHEAVLLGLSSLWHVLLAELQHVGCLISISFEDLDIDIFLEVQDKKYS